MSDFNAALTAGFYDEKKRAEAKNLLEEEFKDSTVGEYEKMFPALMEDNSVKIPTTRDSIPEYSYKNGGEPSEQPKKLSQNQRYKLNLQKNTKIIEEQQQELLNRQRENDELVLRNAQREQELEAQKLRILELEAKQLDQRVDDELFRKSLYMANEQTEEASKADKRVHELMADKKEKEKLLGEKKIELHNYNNIINQAYKEYQSKDYVYRPTVYQEEDDDSKKEALKRFLNAHPFLDAENANNPNFSRNLFEKANRIALELEDRYKIEGRGEDIKTDHYYKDLSTNLKNQLRVEYNVGKGGNSSNNTFYPQDDGLNVGRFQDYSAPVTPTNRSRSAYTAPMSEADRNLRANFINQSRGLGIPEEELVKSYDEIYNKTNQSL